MRETERGGGHRGRLVRLNKAHGHRTNPTMRERERERQAYTAYGTRPRGFGFTVQCVRLCV
jgi:hypothetical protein